MNKQFYWLERWVHELDRDRYNDDKIEHQILFYGTYTEITEEVEKLNNLRVSMHVGELEKKLVTLKDELQYMNEAQKFYDGLSVNQKKFANQPTPYKLSATKRDIYECERLISILNDPNVTKKSSAVKLKEGETYWEWSEFDVELKGFEWVYEDDENFEGDIVGFREV